MSKFQRKSKVQKQDEASDELGSPESMGVVTPDEERVDSESESEENEKALDPLEQALRERDEYLASWTRAQADYQNLRRRTLADIESALRRDRSLLLGEVIAVLDFLDMALLSPCESADAQALKTGVQLTRDQLWKILEEQGLAPIDTGGKFDPEQHQAVATVEDDGEPGRVVEVQRGGYTLRGEVLRHAQVKVSAAPGGDSTSASNDVEAEA